ncbi:MAG: hypothetical protein JSR63_04225 [Proteobacteria bacterium]|nr:hypothetical protein [Pseudomonadota bacterium]
MVGQQPDQGIVVGQTMLTFWLPERIDTLLVAHERRCQCSRSDMLRAILRQYLYGISGDPDQTPALSQPVVQVRRGEWGGRLPQLGKNIAQAKLLVPSRWSQDLSALGAEAGVTRSHFAREIVVTALLGHAYLPARSSRSSCC